MPRTEDRAGAASESAPIAGTSTLLATGCLRAANKEVLSIFSGIRGVDRWISRLDKMLMANVWKIFEWWKRRKINYWLVDLEYSGHVILLLIGKFGVYNYSKSEPGRGTVRNGS